MKQSALFYCKRGGGDAVSTQESPDTDDVISLSNLKLLRQSHILAIEEALKKVAPFGEVRLIVENGCLRYVRTLRSEAIDNAVNNSKRRGRQED
jgi:hypothetical protein